MYHLLSMQSWCPGHWSTRAVGTNQHPVSSRTVCGGCCFLCQAITKWLTGLYAFHRYLLPVSFVAARPTLLYLLNEHQGQRIGYWVVFFFSISGFPFPCSRGIRPCSLILLGDPIMYKQWIDSFTGWFCSFGTL